MKGSFSLSQIDMNLLVVFDILLQEQSLTKTAERLDLTTPAVSGAVKRLQQLLNDPVVIRQGRKMQPTSRALELHEKMAPALESIRESLRFFGDNNMPGRIVIGVPPFFDAVVLPELFRVFSEVEHIQLLSRELKLFDQESIESSLIRHQFDLVISPVEINHYNLVSESLGGDELMLVYKKGHSFFSCNKVDEDNIAKARHAAFEIKVGGVSVYDFLIQAKKQKDIIACVASSPVAACQIVANTDMVTVLPSFFTKQISRHLGEQELLDWQPIPFFKQKFNYYLTYHKRYANHPKIAKVKQVLRQVLR